MPERYLGFDRCFRHCRAFQGLRSGDTGEFVSDSITRCIPASFRAAYHRFLGARADTRPITLVQPPPFFGALAPAKGDLRMPMFSFTLVQKIEAHSEQLASVVTEEIRRDPQLQTIASLDCDELSRRAHELLGNLGHWLVARETEVARWSEPLGRSRFEHSVPLHELIRCLLIIKARLISFAREDLSGTVLQIYAEEELEYRVGCLFDEMVYQVAKGYESALHDSISGQRVLGAAASTDGKAKPAFGLRFHATHNKR
jgi:hypothetical protein